MLRSSSRTSTKTGVAPACTITFAVAGQVMGVVITSSPGPTPSASSERCSAAVPDDRATACCAPTYSANRSSSSAVRGPVVSQPERSVSATASLSSSPIAGGWNERKVSRLRESFGVDIGGDEAYALRRGARPLERLRAAVADRLHRAGPVGADAQVAEAPAGRPIDPRARDAFDRQRLVHTLDRAKLARPRRQEPRHRATRRVERREHLRRDRLAERGRERELVQVDAERRLAELRVVPAPE